ncbi:MAG: thioredoxin family protein [Armatimonadetes bacterium]|nr:thioredoxin family protein [Armatimonadota bacterium]
MIRIVLIQSPTGCHKCEATLALLEQLAAERPGEIELDTFDTDDPKAARYGLLMTPATIINDFIIATGKVPRRDKLVAYLEKVGAG